VTDLPQDPKELLARNNGGPCPGCGRVMSLREKAEQGACNDCYGGPYWPKPEAER
jgi:hypothetical protein